MNGPNGINPANSALAATVEQRDDLAQSRRRATEAALDRAKAGEAQRASSRESVRAQLERAVGANTRLSIERNESALTFVYRAIDRDTGEVLREWPPADFARFVEDVLGKNAISDSAGALLDKQA